MRSKVKKYLPPNPLISTSFLVWICVYRDYPEQTKKLTISSNLCKMLSFCVYFYFSYVHLDPNVI